MYNAAEPCKGRFIKFRDDDDDDDDDFLFVNCPRTGCGVSSVFTFLIIKQFY